MKKVSIIVPVFRTEKYVKRCVDSLISQTYKNIEILLIDDGSDDSSSAICDELESKDDRIFVFHKKNGGLSDARNYGLDKASGDYISFVDSDDFVSPDFIEILVNILESTDSDMAKIDYVTVNNDTLPVFRNKNDKLNIYTGRDVETAFLELNIDSVCVFLYTREIIGDTCFIKGKTSEDIPFNFRIFLKAKKFSYKPIRKYAYFSNPDSISNGPLDKNMLNYLFFRKEILDFYLDKKELSLIKKAKSLYARAAMGLNSRMALYGITDELDEDDCRNIFKKDFNENKKEFYSDKKIPLSRKFLAFTSFHFYPVLKKFGEFLR